MGQVFVVWSIWSFKYAQKLRFFWHRKLVSCGIWTSCVQNLGVQMRSERNHASPPENTDSGIVQEAERPCHALGDWRRTLQRGKCDFFDIHSVAVLLDEWALYWLVQFLALGVCWTLYQARHACILVCANPVWTEIVLHRSGGICAYQHLRILGPEFTGLGHFRSCTVDLPLSNYSTFFFLVGCISMFVLYILCHSLWSMTLDHH